MKLQPKFDKLQQKADEALLKWNAAVKDHLITPKKIRTCWDTGEETLKMLDNEGVQVEIDMIRQTNNTIEIHQCKRFGKKCDEWVSLALWGQEKVTEIYRHIVWDE